MSLVLIIAIGNPLRSDDGLAWCAAEEFRRDSQSLDAEIVTVHQLTPELAEPASQADLVIFIDAATAGEPGTLRSERISAADEAGGFSHILTPQSLLSLAERLYEKKPKAFLLLVSGKSFGHSESLSPEVEQALPGLLAMIRHLIRSGS